MNMLCTVCIRVIVVVVVVCCLLADAESRYTGRGTFGNAAFVAAACSHHVTSGSCSFYACVDEQADCPGTFARSPAHALCHRQLHHQDWQQNSQGSSLHAPLNKCLIEQVFTALSQGSVTRVCRATATIFSSAFSYCKLDLCEMIDTEKQQVLDVFGSRNWMSVVEAARFCEPRVVSKFVFWALSKGDRLHALHHHRWQ